MRMTEPVGETSVRAQIVVRGLVQGVGYRAFAVRAGTRHGLFGGVRNLDDGRVELDVEGTRAAIEALLHELKVGPPGAHVTGTEVEWKPATGRFSGFTIWY
jgi:acylphosphatase